MKKYHVEYKRCKGTYTAEALEREARKYGRPDLVEEPMDDCDWLKCAVHVFLSAHFMSGGNAELDTEDADTEGRAWQRWIYRSCGSSPGRINATTITED